MSTYRYVAYAVLDALQQNFDDGKININHVTFWTTVCANQLRQQRQSKKTFDSGAYLVQFTNVKVLVDGKRKYSNLPMAILDIDNDSGVNTITYANSEADDCDDPLAIPFERTSPAAYHTLYNVPIRKPKPSSPYFYRANSIQNIDNIGRFYYLGIENIDVDFVDMFLYVAYNPQNIVNIDSVVPVEEDQIVTLIARVVQIMKFAMLVEPDRTNDGSDKQSQRGLVNANISDGEQENQQSQPQQ